MSAAVSWVLLLVALPRSILGAWGYLAEVALVALLILSFLIAAAGLVVLMRHDREVQGKTDPFLLAFSRVPPDYTKGWRRWIRPLMGRTPRSGDLVTVRDFADIRATLDARGMLDGLPFMPEMLAYCGHSFTVDRRIDKINDWKGGNELRRMKNVVTLVDVRCDGSQHGGCEAGCQNLWHERWLCQSQSRTNSSERTSSHVKDHARRGAEDTQGLLTELRKLACREINGKTARTTKYTCQNTELPTASSKMSKWDLRQDLRPLLGGNIGLRGYLVATLTAVFNKAQSMRGGIPYPLMAPQLGSGPTPTSDLGLQPGELVRVRAKYEIGLSLYRYHNRGMWFGEETLRHCGNVYTVLRRVTKLIDERSGELREMATPAIVLDRATATGEFMRFCPQNEFVFWREIWLERVAGSKSAKRSPQHSGAQMTSCTRESNR